MPTLDYITVDQLKATLSLSGQVFADDDISAAITAASRAIDNECGRHFWIDDDDTTVQYYNASSIDNVVIDDLVVLSELAVDFAGDKTYSSVWTSTQFDLGPYNAANIHWPYEWIRRRWLAGWFFPAWLPKCVRVTGQFGWPEVPGTVQDATTMLAHRLLRRKREAPFAIQTLGMGAAGGARGMRISQTDPDVAQMLEPYKRYRPFL